ncbi:MAG: ankyrin repeat domain-containing protein [Leptospiraceae bacterium]|nr:ankyrin repeat domain-containing protein [Leptospiraceae bacterium]MCP5494564.1 ankyrin repeat domain-containing protein [Leptospiraceae bacterium]
MQTDFELIEEPPYEYANQDLWDSIRYNSLRGLELAIADGADVNFQQVGLTPLQKVIELNKMEFIRVIVEHGANVNQGNPLLTAIEKNNIELIKLLVEHGANYNARDQDGNSCLMKAIDVNEEIAIFLLDAGSKPYG